MRNARLLLVLAGLVLLAAPTFAQGGTASARLRAFDEVPAAFNPNGGTFSATISEDGTAIDWELNYTVPEGSVTQAHIHLAQKGVNGGITLFFCSNLPNPPAGTPPCPAHDGALTGTFTSSNVLAVAAQSHAAGDIQSVVRAIKAGVAYANVHTDLLPGGTIRGQIVFTAAP